MSIITLAECQSTNTTLARDYGDTPHGTTLRAVCQSAGRGQRGNSWEAEPGLNLTFSTLLRPTHIAPNQQFSISEAVSLAIVETLRRYIPEEIAELAVKWPNDIYAGDLKICGILIENSLTGNSIDRSIAGVGINVNQRIFKSDAPNPVSVICLTNQFNDLETMLFEVVDRIIELSDLASTPSGRQQIHNQYLSNLWRRTGIHRYALPDGSIFNASIYSISPDGILTLCDYDHDCMLRPFAFKEVAALL